MQTFGRAFRSLKLVMLCAIIGSLFNMPAYAEDEEDETKAEVHYVPLKPSFVTNYQARKLRYFKTDVSIVANSSATVEAIQRHELYIRHNLVMLFSSQDQTTLNSQEGKRKLQEDALNQAISALNAENEPSDISGILFTSFIVE